MAEAYGAMVVAFGAAMRDVRILLAARRAATPDEAAGQGAAAPLHKLLCRARGRVEEAEALVGSVRRALGQHRRSLEQGRAMLKTVRAQGQLLAEAAARTPEICNKGAPSSAAGDGVFRLLPSSAEAGGAAARAPQRSGQGQGQAGRAPARGGQVCDEELAALPSYMAGRLGADRVNRALGELAALQADKYRTLAAPPARLGERLARQCRGWREQEGPETRGVQFFAEADVREAHQAGRTGLRLDTATGKALLATLVHLGRLRPLGSAGGGRRYGIVPG